MGGRFAALWEMTPIARLLTDTAVLRELERKEPAEHQRRKQPEPTPAPTSEPEAPSAPETGREPVRSTIANKGFF
jgi:hypothetical protein